MAEQLQNVRERNDENINRLVSRSAKKHFNATSDINWNSEEMKIHADDPRFDLLNVKNDSFAQTEWYQGLPQKDRIKIGKLALGSHVKNAIQFEHAAQIGILKVMDKLPKDSSEYKYLVHEMAEEAQHTLMFEMFLSRLGVKVHGAGPLVKLAMNLVGHLANFFPEVFFFWAFVLEDSGDHYYKACAKDTEGLHPLFKKISSIHVIEEARHISFAKTYLKKLLPTSPLHRRIALSIMAPLIVKSIDMVIREVPAEIQEHFYVPKSVKDDIRTHSFTHRKRDIALRESIKFSRESKIINERSRWLWQSLKLIS